MEPTPLKIYKHTLRHEIGGAPRQCLGQRCQCPCRNDVVPFGVEQASFFFYAAPHDIDAGEPDEPDGLFQKAGLFGIGLNEKGIQAGMTDDKG